ncbi:MAG: phosphoribosyltransferase family protein [Candidatus Bathyarchaeota archaeon]|nr:phosphoribosyltransferase family protein [Candidatus Bathyarchaeota archaeon]
MPPKVTEEPAYRDRTFIFNDRFHAGKLLAEKLRKYAGKRNVALLAVPAGGVPVGYIVARELGIKMDVIVVRKIQIPWNTEAGFGAVTWDGETVLNEHLVRRLNLTDKTIEYSISKTKRIVEERLRRFRGDEPLPDLKGKTVILVDDGLASGFTMLAAARSVRRSKPRKIVVAVPTASLRAVELLSPEADEIACLNIRSGPLFAVADAYKNWYDLADEEVVEVLQKVQGTR